MLRHYILFLSIWILSACHTSRNKPSPSYIQTTEHTYIPPDTHTQQNSTSIPRIHYRSYYPVHSVYEASTPIIPSSEYDDELYEVGYESSTPLSPEPYRKDSTQSDPELLGPASTLTHTLPVHAPISPSTQPMSPTRCQALLGQARYMRYLKRDGSVQEVLKRCRILANTH